MAINGIQFQKGLSLAQFMKDYGTEEQCQAALKLARWPRGFECPRCSHGEAFEYDRRGRHHWQCKACKYQCTLRAGTIMEHSQLPLTKWYLAIYLMTQSKTNIAALAMMRQLGISWKAAWLLKHKLMEVMAQREADMPLAGDVRVDDAYLGGERTGGGPGRGSKNKVAFVAAVEMRDGRPQRLRFDPVASFSFAALGPWAKKAIVPGSCVTSDGLLGFEVLERLNYQHKVVQAPRGKAGTEIEPFKWLNVVLGNLKTALSGTHHAFSFAKYARRYLAEVQYRFNRRSDMASMVPRMAYALARTRPCPARSKTNIAALAMMRQLGISWKAAWLLKHKLMEVMAQREADMPLAGDVRVDDAYLGGERTGGGPGRGSKNKVAFVAAVEMRDGRPQRLRFDPVASFSFAALGPWAKKAIVPGSCVTSDGLLGFEVLERLNYQHKVVQAPRGKAGTEIEPFKWLNVVLGNLKTALSGTHHAFSFAKYARRYLAEVQYRFNRRSDMASMVPRMAYALARTRPCPARSIRGKSGLET